MRGCPDCERNSARLASAERQLEDFVNVVIELLGSLPGGVSEAETMIVRLALEVVEDTVERRKRRDAKERKRYQSRQRPAGEGP